MQVDSVVETLKEMTGGRTASSRRCGWRPTGRGQHYMPRLLEWTANGELDPSFLATHRLTLEDGPRGTTSSSTRRTAACASCSRPDPTRLDKDAVVFVRFPHRPPRSARST